MNSIKNYSILLLALSTAAAIVVAWWEHSDLMRLRAVALAERSELNKLVWDAQRRVGQLEKTLAAATDSGASDPAMQDPAEMKAISSTVEKWLELLAKPEAQRLMATQERASIASRYAGLFAKLNLPPDEQAKLRDLLVNRQMAEANAATASMQQGISPMQDVAGFQAAVQSARAEVDDEIQSTLGPSAYALYAEYQRTRGLRSVVGQIQGSLSYGTAQLTPEQNAQMSQIVAQTDPVGRGILSGNSNPGEAANPGGLITDDAITQMQQVLSPQQIQAVKDVQSAQQARMQLQRMLNGP